MDSGGMGIGRESVEDGGSGVSGLRGAAKEAKGRGGPAHTGRFCDWGACAGQWIQVTDAGCGGICGLLSATGYRDGVSPREDSGRLDAMRGEDSSTESSAWLVTL